MWGHDRRVSHLEDMTTADIAEAVEAGRRRPNFYCRIMFGARPYAFAAFAAQYLLSMGADPLWILATTLCVLTIEDLTNRYTLKTYTTSQIVDHWLKRAEIVEVRARRRNIVLLLSIVAIALTVFWAGAPSIIFHAIFLFAMVSVLMYAKSRDHVRGTSTRIEEIGRGLDPEDPIFFYKCSGYLAFGFLQLWPLVLYFAGGIAALGRKEQVFVLLAVLWPLLGCIHGETMRFLVVRKELERLRDSFGPERPPA